VREAASRRRPSRQLLDDDDDDEVKYNGDTFDYDKYESDQDKKPAATKRKAAKFQAQNTTHDKKRPPHKQGLGSKNKKRADRKDSNPKAATRQRRTAPEEAAAVAAPVDDDGGDDLGTILDTLLSKLVDRKEAAFKSMDDDVCAKGLEIKKLMTLIENGRAKIKL
jgi:hypothetical protein